MPKRNFYLFEGMGINSHVEGTPAHHPLCIELIDIEERLRAFLHEHAAELRHVRAVMFRCELVL